MLKRDFLLSGEGSISNLSKYIVFTAYGLYLTVFGLAVDSPSNILEGLYSIITDPDLLISDYIGIGGMGAAFVNSGILTLITIYILYHLKINITGATISTIFLMSGFALFGKNIFNVWFIIIGVYIYAKYQKESFTKYVYIAFLGTSLSPMVTQIMIGTDLPKVISFPLGILSGLSIGFILPPLAASLMRVHQGFSLYNIGFTSGIIGTIYISILRSYGIATQGRLVWTTGNNNILGAFLVPMFSSMIVLALLMDSNSVKAFKKILNYPGKLVTDFVILEGFAPSLLNMGINGLVSIIYIIIIGGDLNGPTIGGILTIAGFGAFGKHIKNITPIVLGIFIGSLTKIWNINDPAIQLAVLFGTTLAPVSGEFGWKYGIIAGFIHSSVVSNVSYLHGGTNLYNNGFSGGIVAAVLVPVIEAFRKDDF